MKKLFFLFAFILVFASLGAQEPAPQRHEIGLIYTAAVMGEPIFYAYPHLASYLWAPPYAISETRLVAQRGAVYRYIWGKRGLRIAGSYARYSANDDLAEYISRERNQYMWAQFGYEHHVQHERSSFISGIGYDYARVSDSKKRFASAGAAEPNWQNLEMLQQRSLAIWFTYRYALTRNLGLSTEYAPLLGRRTYNTIQGSNVLYDNTLSKNYVHLTPRFNMAISYRF